MKRTVVFTLGLATILSCISLAESAYTRFRRHRIFTDAIDAGNVQQVRAMLDRGEPVDGYPEEDEYMSPLEQAAAAGQNVIVKLLLDRGADIDVVSGWGSPLDGAARAGHLSIVKLLVQRGALKNYKQDTLDHALWGAAVEGQIPTVQYLLQKGADPVQAERISRDLISVCRDLKQFQAASLLAKGAASRARRKEQPKGIRAFPPFGVHNQRGRFE